MAADEADGLGSSVFIFAPKVIGKLGANHAIIGIGMYTNKDSRMIISQHIKLFSDEKKLGRADQEKKRKHYCKRVESMMSEDQTKWVDIIANFGVADILDPDGEI